MERILSSKQMRLADDYTINTLGVPEEILIERAGSAVADEIIHKFRGGRVLVVVGKGNNGEDGKVIAKKLSLVHGFSVSVLNAKNGILKLFDKTYDIIVDCIFGTGLSRDVDGKYKEIIEKINNSNAFIVSCDIPSGINGDTGRVMGVAVKANLTVAIGEYKLGHFLGDGIDYSGHVVLKDIGISVWDEDIVHRFNASDVKKFFPVRDRNVHKGTFGKTAVIGGSLSYTGSILLSQNSLCALKMGAGYSYVGVPKSVFSSLLGKNPECILTLLSDDGKSLVFNENDYSKFLSHDSIAFGMGVGVSEEIYRIIKYFLSNYTGTLILDADALNTISTYGTEILKDKKCKVILTPHVKEFSRLLKANIGEIMPDIIEKVKQFANDFDLTLVVKSAVSVISDGKEVYINTTGNSCLSKAGSGDVLSGLMAGITARCDDPLGSALSACYLFGLAGEISAKKQNEYTVTATDVINNLYEAVDTVL